MVEFAAAVPGGDFVWPRRALVDPSAQLCDLFFGEALAFGGHHRVGVLAEDIADEETVGAFSENDGFAVVTAGERIGFAVEPEAAFVFFGPMTLIAVIGENGLDVASEVDCPLAGDTL